MPQSLKIIVAVLALLLLGVGGGGFWLYRVAADYRQEADALRRDAADQQAKAREVQRNVQVYEAGGARDYYYRMLPDVGDDLLVHTFRVFDDIEREAGVYVFQGKPARSKSKASRARGKGLPAYEEQMLTLTVYADYQGLVRFIEGIEKECDRPVDRGGGRLFEVKGLRTVDKTRSGGEEGGTAALLQPGWKFFEIDVAFFNYAGGRKS